MLSRLKNIIAKIKEFNKLPPPESRSGQLYAVTALFEKPDQIIKAANEVAVKGYKDFDVMTPYPVHGMDDAMKLSSTKIGFVAFALGITGTMLALLMIGWMSGIDYKNVIGGKPFFAIPPSIPITFEVTVLLASITTVLGMLILFNKLPWISNPLQDSDYMRRVSSDMFGIIIEAKDKKFNEREVRSLFQGLGSNIIEPVYYPVVDIDKPKTPIFSPKFMTTLAVTALLTAAASYLTLNYLLYDVEPFNWMWKQPKVLPQTTSSFFSDGWSMRRPVEGTVARGFIPYEYKGIPDSLIKVFYVNPLPVSREIIEKGKKRFETYCSPCHGYYAKGDSRLKGQFPAPPTLHSDKVRNWSDGNIYHMITNGRNAMPSYEKQISRDDRWAIIHYIRVLQRSQNAKDQDLEGK
ncbi:MAG: quinol:electron acceptor oxidoreductase subunit ActD [Ignavibacteria bacterium]